MKITGVDIWSVVVPTRPGTVNSPEYGSAGWDQMSKHLIRINTSDGVYGIGETGRGCPRPAVETTAATLVDRDPLAIPLQDVLASAPLGSPFGPARTSRDYEGAVGAGQTNPAYDAFEMAVFDLVGRALDVPVHYLLGGAMRERVPADYWIGRQNPEDAARNTRLARERGFHGLKMKCTLDDSWVERIQAITDAGGEDFQITIDPNERFYRPAEAIALARELERFPNIAVYEDPVPKWNLDWYRQIRAAIATPLALHLSNPRDIVNAIKAEACDVMNLGGSMVQFLRNAAMAAAAGMLCWHGSGVDLGITEHAYLHAAACARNCVLPSDLVGSWTREDDLIVQPIQFDAGHALVPSQPGLGCELDLAAVERYRLSG